MSESVVTIVGMRSHLPTEALVAHVLVAKYADHTPLYRQAQIYARQGITLDRSTLADWVGRAAFALRPVHARLLAQLKQSTKLFADETTAPVLDPGRGRVKKGQLWAYPMSRGRAGPGLLAHLLFAKYGLHLPLNRQSNVYAREGIDLNVSTLADWVIATFRASPSRATV